MAGRQPGQYVACQKRQSVSRIPRQYATMHVFTQKENRLLLLSLARIAPRRLDKRLQRDGSQEKAGDGTRTRDSLLGRNVLIFFSFYPHFTASLFVESIFPIFLSNFAGGGCYAA